MKHSMSRCAQQSDRVRRISVLTSGTVRDPETQADYAAFLQELKQLGWSDGRTTQLTVVNEAGPHVCGTTS